VTVLKKKNLCYPVLEGVAVIVRIKNSKGEVLFDRVIDSCDLWRDVETRYFDVVCENDEIRIGPKYWNDGKTVYLRINKKLESNIRPKK